LCFSRSLSLLFRTRNTGRGKKEKRREGKPPPFYCSLNASKSARASRIITRPYQDRSFRIPILGACLEGNEEKKKGEKKERSSPPPATHTPPRVPQGKECLPVSSLSFLHFRARSHVEGKRESLSFLLSFAVAGAL